MRVYTMENVEIRDIVHAARLLKKLQAKASLINLQIEYVRHYLLENS